jgi:mannose-1-phosphate guanylyltransferase
VLEPVGRNSATGIAVTALLALRISRDALVLVLLADHVILNEAAAEVA